LDAKYVSAPEACRRIFKFAISDRSHAISRLAVPLQLKRNVFFQPGNEQLAVVNGASTETVLTDYFKLNRNPEAVRRYFYREIPHPYRFDQKSQS
jgi:hypothetical protein